MMLVNALVLRRIALRVVFIAACSGSDWDLPVRLGESRSDVHAMLGPPNDVLSAEALRRRYPDVADDFAARNPNRSNESHYSSGLTIGYDGDQVYRVSVLRQDWVEGWILYSDPVVEGIRLSDTKATIFQKLGRPAKTESNSLSRESGLTNPSIFPVHDTYYWRKADYTIEVQVLRHPMQVDSAKSITWPSGLITGIIVYR